MKISALIIFILLVALSCNNQKDIPITDQHALPRVYADSVNGFSINFPEEWETVPDWNQTTVTAMGKPLDETSSMRLDGSMAVKIFELKGYTSGDIFRQNTASLSDSPDFKILEQYNCKISGLDAICVIYSVIENETSVVNTQFYVCTQERCAILNGSASMDLFERYRDLYLQIGLSFRFL